MKAEKFILNILKYSIPTVISAFIGIIIIPITTNIYPTTEYGKISLYYSVGTMLASVFMLGLSNSCIRFFFEPINGSSKEQLFNFAFFTGVIITIIIFIISLSCFRNTISFYFFGEENTISLLLFFVYIGSNIAYRLQSNYARLSCDAKLFNIQQVLYIIINKVFFLSAVIYSTSYYYAILLMTIGLLIEVIIIGKKSLTFSFSFPSKMARSKLLIFALPLLPMEIAVMLNNSIAKLLLGFYKDYHSLGILSMATNIASTFNLVSNAFSVYWSPFMFANYKKEQKMIQRIHNAVLLVSIITVCCIFVLQDILYVILGMNYRSSQPYFLLIMLMPIQMLICETTSYGIGISKKTYFNMSISFIACVVNTIISYLLYPYIGVNAMALGIALSAITQMILKTVIGQRFYTSICSKKQTLYGIFTVCFLCLLNFYLYNNWKVRFFIGILIIGLSIIVFFKETKDIYYLCFKFLKKTRKNIY